MKKTVMIIFLILSMYLAYGCARDEGERVLVSAGHARTVTDYSAGGERLLETEMETETDLSLPEAETETVQTEPEPVPETEKETEKPVTISEYDFSDDAIRNALLEATASETGEYGDRTTVSDAENVRERRIKKGALGAVLYSRVPGSESSQVELFSTDQNLLMRMVKVLGMPQDESGYSNLFNGTYDGENAGCIGLEGLSRWQGEDGIHLLLTRSEEKAKPMEWEKAGTSLEDVLHDSILMQELRTGDGIREIIQGVEYGEVIQKEFSVGSPVIERDQSGEVITAGGSFHAAYTAGNRIYDISTDTDAEGKTGLLLALSSETEITDEEVLAEFEHIYQSFYNGVFTEGFDSNEVCVAEHAQIEKHSQNSFTMKMF